jgi:hypothetical protein
MTMRDGISFFRKGKTARIRYFIAACLSVGPSPLRASQSTVKKKAIVRTTTEHFKQTNAVPGQRGSSETYRSATCYKGTLKHGNKKCRLSHQPPLLYPS